MKDKGAPFVVQLIVVVIVIIVGIILYNRREDRREVLNANYRYVIGTTTGTVSNHRSSSISLKYTYFFRGDKYASQISVAKWTGNGLRGIKTDRGHYIVKVNPEDPNNSEMLITIPVRRVPAVVSDTGWIDIPRWIIELNEKKYGDKK